MDKDDIRHIDVGNVKDERFGEAATLRNFPFLQINDALLEMETDLVYTPVLQIEKETNSSASHTASMTERPPPHTHPFRTQLKVMLSDS